MGVTASVTTAAKVTWKVAYKQCIEPEYCAVMHRQRTIESLIGILLTPQLWFKINAKLTILAGKGLPGEAVQWIPFAERCAVYEHHSNAQSCPIVQYARNRRRVVFVINYKKRVTVSCISRKKLMINPWLLKSTKQLSPHVIWHLSVHLAVNITVDQI